MTVRPTFVRFKVDELWEKLSDDELREMIEKKTWSPEVSSSLTREVVERKTANFDAKRSIALLVKYVVLLRYDDLIDLYAVCLV